MGTVADGGRIVDVATLRYLAGVLARQPGVSRTSLFPSNRQETLVVSILDSFYPPSVESIRLELRRYTNGDFHVSYLEVVPGTVRRCRWDRHEQEHNTRDHFHPLPNASAEAAEDRGFPTDLMGTLETVVLPWVDERLGLLWAE